MVRHRAPFGILRSPKQTLDLLVSALHRVVMQIARKPLIGIALTLGGCFYNPTIDQEIAGKCDISETDYQHAEATLDKGRDGMSLRAGKCRLTRASKGVVEGTVVDG